MAFGRKTEEEQASAAAQRDAAAHQKALDKEAAHQAEEWAKFWASPQGLARRAYEAGDRILQSEFEVMAQKAVVAAMMGAFNTSKTKDPTAILNAIASEGWELITGSFVFVVQGEESRDKFMASGQNIAVKGVTMGYYLFRRCESNRTVA